MKKQQLDYEEALGSLKKISHTNQFVDENLKLHQLNVNLTAELEDYRTQTKRLLADLQQKDATLAENGAEVDQLRQQGAYHSSSSSDVSNFSGCTCTCPDSYMRVCEDHSLSLIHSLRINSLPLFT